MPRPDLIEIFFHENLTLFNAKHALRQRRTKLDIATQDTERQGNIIQYAEQEIAEQQQRLRSLTFELMLHTPCRKFAKLAPLLDL